MEDTNGQTIYWYETKCRRCGTLCKHHFATDQPKTFHYYIHEVLGLSKPTHEHCQKCEMLTFQDLTSKSQ